MKSALKRLVPAKPDSHWGPPHTLWRVTSFLVFALMFGLSHANNIAPSISPSILDGQNVIETEGNPLVELPEESSALMPAGDGHITGTVTDSSGNPIEGIKVAAYNWDGSDWVWVNSDSTDASGSYDIGGLGTDTYRLRFRDLSGTYAIEYYNNAPDIDSATDIAVTSGATKSNINAQLVSAAHITGRVTDTAGNPLEGIDVAAYRWNGSKWVWINTNLTDASGSYNIGGLNTGTYHVRFRDPSGTYATEYYDNAPNISSGTDLAITAGATTSDINAQLSFAGSITGTVTDTAGNPLEGIRVAAYNWDGSDWVWVNSDSTDASGSYDIGDLNTSTYRVRFRDSSGTYAVEYYNDAFDIDSATDIEVTTGTLTTGIDAQLVSAAHITGTVTDAVGNPFEGIDVAAYRWNGSKWVWINAVLTDASGSYDIGGLNTGTYHVRFRDPSETYAIEYYDNAPDISSGTDLAITAGATTSNINAQLASAGNISGTVTDTAGAPIEGIQVEAYYWNGTRWVWGNDDFTNASGNYDVGELKTGIYRLRFDDPSGTYAIECYDDVLDFDSARDIMVTVGTTSNINAQLALAGNVTGTVTAEDTGGSLMGVNVTAYRWNGTNWFWVNLGFTDASGNYDLGGLAAGSYRLRFSNVPEFYASEFYDNVPDINSGTDIEITAETTTSGINAQLGFAANISGMVMDSGVNPLKNITVRAYRWNGTWWEGGDSDLTDASGNYEIGGLNIGTYRLEFKDSSGSYATEYYDDAPNIENATDIQVTSGINITDINAHLASAAHFTGTVTNSSGNLEGIQVAVYRLEGSNNWIWLNADLTDASGNYDIGGLNTGTYRLRFRDSSGTYATEYYNDVLDFDSAMNIVVTVGTTRSNIDALLVLAGHITGTVTDSAGNPLIGIDVAAYRWNGSSWHWVNADSTDVSGYYDISGLGTGTYHVRFMAPSGICVTEYYDDAPNQSSGTDIAVTAGETTFDINAELTCLHSTNNVDVIIDFGSEHGLWMWMNNNAWGQLYQSSADSMVTGDIDGSGQDDVIIDFGIQYGIRVHMNNNAWVQLDSRSPESMVTGDIDGSGQDDVIIDFGSDGIWVWMNNSTLVSLDTRSPESMVTGDIDGSGQDDVIIDFGSDEGIWVWMNNSTLDSLAPDSSESMVTGDIDGSGQDDVIIGFGSDGIWLWMNNSTWAKLHFLSSESMVTGDIDGSGQDDIIIDFGSQYGILLWMNNSTWDQLHFVSSESMVTGDIDDNGQDDVIIDFGSQYGIWRWMNNNAWALLNRVSSESMVTGNIDRQ
ncbi:MAG: carboxypeptidase regulatory-like domain-containing protein [Pseudomonadota bacterium]